MINELCLNLTEQIPILDVEKVKKTWEQNNSESYAILTDVDEINTIQDLIDEINSHDLVSEGLICNGWGEGLIPEAYKDYIHCQLDDDGACYLVFDQKAGALHKVSAAKAKNQMASIVRKVAIFHAHKEDIKKRIGLQHA